MTRHGKNSTASSVYSYHERKKDASQSGYGSKAVRLSKDSVAEFDCCCLTLQPCRNPVVTPDGFIFDKEALLEYIIFQKREIARKLKEYEKQKQKLKDDNTTGGVGKQLSSSSQGHAVSQQPTTSSASKSSSAINNMEAGKDKHLPSFWIPSLTPEAKKTEIKKPDEKVYCPMSGKPLRLKDLTDVHFKEIDDGDKKSLITKTARYVCAVSNDVLSNSTPCAVLKTSGNVVTMESVEKIIKKDMVDPTCGKHLTDKDIIPLQRGATGFSGAGVALDAKKEGPAMPV